MAAFREAMGREDVVAALNVAPFGYVSKLHGDGFRFEVATGHMRGRWADSPTLLGAVAAATRIRRPFRSASLSPEETRG